MRTNKSVGKGLNSFCTFSNNYLKGWNFSYSETDYFTTCYYYKSTLFKFVVPLTLIQVLHQVYTDCTTGMTNYFGLEFCTQIKQLKMKLGAFH